MENILGLCVCFIHSEEDGVEMRVKEYVKSKKK